MIEHLLPMIHEPIVHVALVVALVGNVAIRVQRR
jgi:hypothetical protein